MTVRSNPVPHGLSDRGGWRGARVGRQTSAGRRPRAEVGPGWPRRARRGASLAVAALLLVSASQLPANAGAAGPSTEDRAWGKVAGEVRARAEGGAPVPFWVILNGSADLSPARSLAGKAARGARVVTTLTGRAERAQAGLRDLLTRRKAEFRPYWIANAIKVVGDAHLLAEVARRPEVSRIEPDRPLAGPDATAGRALPRAAGTTRPGTRGEKRGPVRRAAANGPEWNIQRVGAPRVWDELGVRGAGIVVANIDTGVKYAFYTLLDVDDRAGVYATLADDQIVVEWRNVQVLEPGSRKASGRISVSVTIRPDGTVTVGYRDVDPGPWTTGANAVAGIQDETGTIAFVLVNLEKIVANGLGFTIRPPKASPPESARSGSVSSGPA